MTRSGGFDSILVLSDVDAIRVRISSKTLTTSVVALHAAIHDSIDEHNGQALPFVWIADADKIIEKAGGVRFALDNESSRFETLH